MDTDDSNKYRIFKIKPKKLQGEDEARKILEKLAEDVQPIMQKHRWRVKKLKEFLNPKLNGLNYRRGVKIRIRLRKFPPMHHKFRPYNDILNTMLHELCHNDFGDHKSDFHNLLNLLKQEYNQGKHTNDSVDGCDAVLSNSTGNQESSGAYTMPWDDSSNTWSGGYNMIPSNNFWDDSSNTQRNAGYDIVQSNNFWDDTNRWNTGYDMVPSNNFWDDTSNTRSAGYDMVPSNHFWDDSGNTGSTGYDRVPSNNFWDDTSNTGSTGYGRVPNNNFWDDTGNTGSTGYDRVPSNNFWDDTSTSNTWSGSAGYDTVPSNNFWDDTNNESDSYHNSDVCTIV